MLIDCIRCEGLVFKIKKTKYTVRSSRVILFSMVVSITVLESFQRPMFRKQYEYLYVLMYITFNITLSDLVLDNKTPAILLNIIIIFWKQTCQMCTSNRIQKDHMFLDTWDITFQFSNTFHLIIIYNRLLSQSTQFWNSKLLFTLRCLVVF